MKIIRRLLDAWNRQDIEGILALVDPEGEYVNAPTAVERGTRRGHDEIVAVMRKQWEILSDGIQEIDRFIDRGDEIITVGRVSRTMPGSDARISNPLLISWKFRDGKLIRLEQLGAGPEFPDALEAAGLVTEDMESAVEKLRGAFDAFNHGDLESVGEWIDQDIEIGRTPFIDPPSRGKEAFLEFSRPNMFERQTVELLSTEVHGNVILADLILHAVGKDSGVEVSQAIFQDLHLAGWDVREVGGLLRSAGSRGRGNG